MRFVQRLKARNARARDAARARVGSAPRAAHAVTDDGRRRRMLTWWCGAVGIDETSQVETKSSVTASKASKSSLGVPKSGGPNRSERRNMALISAP